MKNLCFVLVSLLLFSCSQEEIMLKKFESRLNANEYACASVYLYDGDYPTFSFFCNELKENNPNLLIQLVDCKKEAYDGQDVLIADFELVNSSKQVRNYFANIGYQLSANKTFRDTIFIRKTNEGEKLSFNWGLHSLDENAYLLAKIAGDSIAELSIRTSPNLQSKVIGKLKKGDDVLIDNDKTEEQWAHGYRIDRDGNIIDGYIPSTSLSTNTSSFFSLGLFDSMSLLVAILVFVVICVIFVFGSSIFSMIESIPVTGIIVIVCCILGLLYSAYQLLEKILFELFIINLPY